MWVCLTSGDPQPCRVLLLVEPHTTPGSPVIYRSISQQKLLAVVVVVYWAAVYMSLAAFVNLLAQSQKDRYTIGFYIAFQCLTTFFKLLAKRIGVSADRGKYGTFTMYFALELLCTLFYFTFYRALFDKLDNWWEFAALQPLHFGQEWLLYVSRATPWFWQMYERLYASLEAPPLMHHSHSPPHPPSPQARPYCQQLLSDAALAPGPPLPLSSPPETQWYICCNSGSELLDPTYAGVRSHQDLQRCTAVEVGPWLRPASQRNLSPHG